jgi:hypothetical protein
MEIVGEFLGLGSDLTTLPNKRITKSQKAVYIELIDSNLKANSYGYYLYIFL